MLEKEFEYYKSHQDELVQKFGGKYIVIIGEEVVGAYDTAIDAYTNAQKEHELGSFLLQHCLPGVENYTRTFYSRVSI